MNGKTIFRGLRRTTKERKIYVNTTKAVLMTTIVAGLRLILTAQVAEVDTKSLPAAVQQTINEQASGGEIVEVKREDEP
jgi:hypothetical protein